MDAQTTAEHGNLVSSRRSSHGEGDDESIHSSSYIFGSDAASVAYQYGPTTSVSGPDQGKGATASVTCYVHGHGPVHSICPTTCGSTGKASVAGPVSKDDWADIELTARMLSKFPEAAWLLPGAPTAPITLGIIPYAGQKQLEVGTDRLVRIVAGLIEGNDTSAHQAEFAHLEPSLQKQALGEYIYPNVHVFAPILAGKLTGIMLEMDNQDLLDL
jgi:hypothetical protein